MNKTEQLQIEILKYHLNIPQIERAAKHEVMYYNNTIKEGKIRTFGLEAKIKKRIITLEKILEIIEAHNE